MTVSWDRIGAVLGSVSGLPLGLGLQQGITTIRKFGANRDIDTGTVPESIWSGGGLYPWQDTAVSLEVVSDDAADDGLPVGTGARTVTVQGLDENWEPKEETITMNGLTAVNLAGSWLRVFRAWVETAGSAKTNVGTIDIQIQVGGTVLAVIEPTLGQTTMAVYTIPAGVTGFFTEVRSGVLRSSGAPIADIAIFLRGNDQADRAWRIASEFSAGKTARVAVPRPVPEMTDVVCRCLFTSATNIQVVMEFDVIQVDNAEFS